MSFFEKVTNLVNKGKQKIKEKFNKPNNNEKPQETSKNNLNVNMKIGNSNNEKNTVIQRTKITPVKEKKEDDIFKIEDDDGKEFVYKIQDIDSDEEESDEEQNVSTKNKNEYVIVDKKLNQSESPQKNDEKEKIETSNMESIDPSVKANNSSYKFSKFEVEEENEHIKYENQDIFTFSHRLLVKVGFILINLQGSLINISDSFVIPCIKLKQTKKLLSLVGLSKDIVRIDYLLYFDESYLYPIKNITTQQDTSLRKIGNKYDLKLIRNIGIKVSYELTIFRIKKIITS